MPAQIKYYNRFGNAWRTEILNCPEPEIWTTDYSEKGRVYQEMKIRIAQQEKLVDDFFSNQWPVLDYGCGFGRQAMMLVKKGFNVTGCDTSDELISIAQALFEKHQLQAFLFCGGMEQMRGRHFRQVLLFDVLEHIPPAKRKKFVFDLSNITVPGAVVLISLPHVKKRLTSRLNNAVRKRLTSLFVSCRNREEHPYYIPQLKDLTCLFGKQYSLDSFTSAVDSDYYVFRRKKE